jgi:hypothetical protein
MTKIQKKKRGTSNKPKKKDLPKPKHYIDRYVYQDVKDSDGIYTLDTGFNYKVRKRALELKPHLDRILQDYPATVEYLRPKRTYFKPEKDEGFKKVSPFFWRVFCSLLVTNALTHQETINFKKRYKKFKFIYEDKLPVIVLVDTKKIADTIGASEINIRYIFDHWKDGPIQYIGRTGRLDNGGLRIFQIGYWAGFRKVLFESKKNYESWMKNNNYNRKS